MNPQSFEQLFAVWSDEGNEIEQFRSRRVVGAHSALLGLRAVPELELKPPVENLALRLPDKKQVFVVERRGQDVRTVEQAALDRAAQWDSQLEAFFRANQLDVDSIARRDASSKVSHGPHRPKLEFPPLFSGPESTYK